MTKRRFDIKELKPLRQSNQISLKELAGAADLSVDTIRRAESGEYITLASANKIVSGLSQLLPDQLDRIQEIQLLNGSGGGH